MAVDAVSLPWYIMTSIITHEATVAYFAERGHFGLPPSSLVFFQQRELPAFDLTTGLLVLDSKHRLALSPNGNGGLFDALHHSTPSPTWPRAASTQCTCTASTTCWCAWPTPL